MFYSALIGKPTKHSVAHVMYEEIARAAGIHDSYKHIKIDVEEENLQITLKSFQALSFVGINVTLPHKLVVMKYLDEVDSVVHDLGAVNTVKIGKKLLGYNTDWLGIYVPVRNIKQEKINTVTIFGSGGASRAAIYASKRLGAKHIYVIYKNDSSNEKTDDLKNNQQKLGIHLYEYDQVSKLVDRSQLVINATSAGMIGNDPVPFDLELIKNLDLTSKIFFDVVFSPLNTPLLTFFKDKGAYTIDGLWMMIYQGIAAMSIWLDRELTIKDSQLQEIHKILAKELQNV